MRVYFGSKGRNYFIMAIGNGTEQFKEVYSFNMFGNLENTNCSISSCDNWREVGFISLVGEDKYCELMSNTFKGKMDDLLMLCVAKVRNRGGYIGTIFSIPHKDGDSSYNQVLFLYNTVGDCDSVVVGEFPKLVRGD